MPSQLLQLDLGPFVCNIIWMLPYFGIPQLWASSFISAICDGNDMYDEVYCDTAVYLDVDVVLSVGGHRM